MWKKMTAVMKCDVLVVDEDHLDEAILRTPGSTISGWGTPWHSSCANS